MKNTVKSLVLAARHGWRCYNALAGFFAKQKIRSLLLAWMLIAMTSALSLIACGDGSGTTPPPPAHVHQWGDWSVTKAATCTTAGSQTRTCALDPSHTETEAIPVDPNAHDYRYVAGSGTAPTCTVDGNGNEVCSYNSSHIRSGVVIPKLGHNYEWETTTHATCSAVGLKTGTCTRDENHTTTEEIPIDPDAHDWQAAPGGVAPTCTTAESGTVICSYNAEHTQTASVIPPLGHDQGEWHTTLAATCTATGTRQLRCTRDNAVLNTETIDALGHDSGEWHTTSEADCEHDGAKELRCTRDNFVLQTTAITKLGHNYANWTQTTAPTCTTAGIETGTCTRDGATTTRAGTAALGHDWQWELTSDAEETETCTRCAITNGTRLKIYNLGDTGPGGGKIFYISQTGFTMTDNNQLCHYLEAAPENMSTTLAWASSPFISTEQGGSGDYVFIDGTENTIGTGRNNTILILAVDTNAPAAKACREYANNGKTDWFLPNTGELEQLNINRNIFENLEYDFAFWSSEQNPWPGSTLGALLYVSSDSYTGISGSYKSSMLSVRAVRAF